MQTPLQQACRRGFRLSLAILFFCLPGCEGPPSAAGSPGSSRDMRGIAAAERAAGDRPQPSSAASGPGPAAAAGQRVATAAGAPVFWEDLHPALAEAAGAQALRELVLDRMLAAEMRRLGIAITPEDIARERNLVAEAIARDAAASPADTERLLEGVRRGRGLGPYRFERLLERTAKLRRLIAGEVEIAPEELSQAYDMKHGPRYRVRAAVFATDREAAEARETLPPTTLPSPPSPDTADLLTARFAELATRRSIDPSAQRGGLLEPISPADPAYPAALRQVLPRLRPGEISGVLAVDRGFALLLLEEIIPGDALPLERAAPAIEAEVRLRRERILMDDLALRLLREANITVNDRSLGWGWEGR